MKKGQMLRDVQGRAEKGSPGLVNFALAVAHHFCLKLAEEFSQPGVHFLAQPLFSV